MRKNIKTLLCVTAFVGAMSSGIAFADDLTISSGSTETISQEATYDNVVNAGTLNNEANLTVNTKLTNSSTIDNSSSIVTKEIGNQSGASITGASGSLKISSGGINDGTIEQNIVSITGGTLVNSGTINATTFSNSGQLTGTGKLIAAGGSNSTTIEQNTIEITGNYTNNGTMTANKEFTNASSDITGNGSLIIKDSTGNSSNGGSISQAIVNISGNKFTNTGSITASQEFTNSAANLENNNTITSNGSFTNTGNITGQGSISANQGGTNTGSMTQNEVTTGGTFNNGDGTTAGTITTDKLTNNGTFNNNSGSSIISDEIIERLRDNCKCLRDLAMIDLLYSTGIRVGELVGLNISDINFEERECVVYGKGDKERRVYFDAKAKLHLQNYIESRVDNNPALFVTLDAPYDRIKISGVEIRIRELGRKLDIEKIHPHKFRRTMATRAIDKGMPIEQVQKILGHSQIDTTMKYAIVNQNNVKTSHRRYIA